MEFLYSKTGSAGNCTILTDGKTTIMIDCGIRPLKVNQEIGYKLSKVQAVLVTHAHADHTKYLSRMMEACVPCHMPPECKETLKTDNYYAKVENPLQTFVVGSLAILPFEIPHCNSDGTPCQNFGYLIYSAYTHERILWCTDCHYIPHNFVPCDYYCLECNYDGREVPDVKSDDVSPHVEKRRFVSHMSLQTCIHFLGTQNLKNAKEIRLLHISTTHGNIKQQLVDEVKKRFSGVEVTA